MVTNADEAAGRRHQPAFLFLPARDMKGGGCSKMEVCDECCRGSLEDGKAAISMAEIAWNGLASWHYLQGRTGHWEIQIMLHNSNIFMDILQRLAVAQEGESQPRKFKISVY